MYYRLQNENRRTAMPCLDCRENHKCGIKCESMRCFEESCGCTAKVIIPGLRQCNVCKLIVCYEDNAFRQYLVEMSEWYDTFYAQNKPYLYRLEQWILLGKSLSEREKTIYDTVEAFCHAKSNFSISMPHTTQLDTIPRRKNAYTLIQSFEKIKKVQF